MTNEEFMKAVSSWRERNPDRQAAYMSSIPKHVKDSMAFEGDKVEICPKCNQLKLHCLALHALIYP